MVKCPKEEDIPEWSSFEALAHVKVEDVWVDDEQIIVGQVEKDFSPRAEVFAAHDHIHDIWLAAHCEHQAKMGTSAITDQSFERSAPTWRWFFVPWKDRDVIAKWENWTEEHWRNQVPHELMRKPFGQVKGCSISKRVGDGQETRPQQRAWDMQVPGVVSYLMLFGTSVQGQGSRQYKGQRLDYNRQQRASAITDKKGKKRKCAGSAIADGQGKKRKRKR